MSAHHQAAALPILRPGSFLIDHVFYYSELRRSSGPLNGLSYIGLFLTLSRTMFSLRASIFFYFFSRLGSGLRSSSETLLYPFEQDSLTHSTREVALGFQLDTFEYLLLPSVSLPPGLPCPDIAVGAVPINGRAALTMSITFYCY